jgi:hypothetical protein
MKEICFMEYYEEYKKGNRSPLVVSMATRYNGMTTEELTEILTSEYSNIIAFRRAMRHPNASPALVARLSKDGGFLCLKCFVPRWDEATAEELYAGAQWMIENDDCEWIAAEYAEHPHADAKTLKLIYRNYSNKNFLWEALLKNPKTPGSIKADIEKRMDAITLNQIKNKISALKDEMRHSLRQNKY